MYGLTKKEKLIFVIEKIQELEISTYEIGKKTGLSISGLDKLVNGIVKNPHEKTLNEIILFLENKVLGTNLKENNTQNEIKEPTENYGTEFPNEIKKIQEVIIEREKIIKLDPSQEEHQKKIIALLKEQIDILKKNQIIAEQ